MESWAVSRELRRAWVRFATIGDPGWAAHRPERPPTRVLDVGSTTAPSPEADSRRIGEGHDPAPSGLA
ncbi:hypothetical protein [Actinomadura kijaniata]|uniref:hypothetical protein n=1 Tax=Actinomadura kijaniata TaxID=46161 RepID=UPI0008298731|nr:hypothetical protein [Actinomadura kijaniata]